MFKRKDMIFMAVILLLAAGMALIMHYSQKGSGEIVRIMIDGREYGSYSMKENQTIEIRNESGFNRIVIEDGSVHMEEADCPDQYCVKHMAITKTNETIVCLPHKLVVEVHAEIKENDIDSVSQ